MAHSKPLVVVAIDIGTKYSGYAFSLHHEYETDKLKMERTDGENCLRTSYKTPTCVLLNPDGEFDSFGYEANTKYSELAKENQHTEWFLFRRFKMNLYKTKINDTMELESLTGYRFEALSVFAMAIGYLKEHCVNNFGHKLADTEIQYVLTVPAIWNEDAKQFMRKAAMQAGILGDRLLLALEPKAASILCKEFVRRAGSENISQPGTRYIIVDAGGGTVDTTVHEVMRSGKLRELHKASGGDWGGTQVDDKFTELLMKIFSTKVMKEFGTKNSADWLELEKEFELNKKMVIGSDKRMATFRLPVSLRETFSLYNKCSLEERVAGSRLSGMVRFIGDKMRLSGQLMQSLMKPTIQNMVTHVKRLLEDPKCEGISHILLVGGFSDSPYLQEMFRQEFQSVAVVTPLDAVLSVAKGAVIFGHDSGAIDIRLAAYTYGSFCPRFIDGIHHPSKLKVIEGIKRCDDKFAKLITMNQEVSYGQETEEEDWVPVHTNQTAMIIQLYRSTEEDPMYTTDPSCALLGSFEVPMPDLTGDKSRAVGVRCVLGGTEFKVKAHEKTTGKTFDATFGFATN